MGTQTMLSVISGHTREEISQVMGVVAIEKIVLYLKITSARPAFHDEAYLEIISTQKALFVFFCVCNRTKFLEESTTVKKSYFLMIIGN